MSTTSLTLRERAALPAEYVRTVGPLIGVTAGRVRDALIGLHAANPAHPMVSRLDRDGFRWEHLDRAEFARFAATAVTDLGHGPLNFEEMTRRLQTEPQGHHPVRILVGGGYLTMRLAPEYAGAANPLLRELARAASETRAAVIPPPARTQAALPKSWWKQVGRHPSRWNIPKQPPPADVGPSRLRAHTARSARVLGEMDAWRQRHAPEAGTPAITLAAFTSALIELGLRPEPHDATFLLEQGPAYLPHAALTDPRAITAALDAELASGRPLTRKMMRAGRALLTGTPAPAESRPGVTFVDRGRHDMLGDLPWAVEPASRINLSVPTRAAPAGITLTSSEMGGVLHLEATFHADADAHDAGVIARALDLTCTDPAGLISALSRR